MSRREELAREAARLFAEKGYHGTSIGALADAIGAARAGLVGVWLNRHGEQPEAVDTADAAAAGVLEIRTLAELPALLADRMGTVVE